MEYFPLLRLIKFFFQFKLSWENKQYLIIDSHELQSKFIWIEFVPSFLPSPLPYHTTKNPKAIQKVSKAERQKFRMLGAISSRQIFFFLGDNFLGDFQRGFFPDNVLMMLSNIYVSRKSFLKNS